MANVFSSRISIIVPAYRRDDLLERCLSSLCDACGGVFPETIVVDDAQQPSTKALVAAKFDSPSVRYVATPKNMGFAGAVNFAYPSCTREFVALVNSDIVFENEPFSELLAFIDGHPAAAIVQGRIVLRNGNPDQDGRIDSCGYYLSAGGVLQNPSWRGNPSDASFTTPAKVFIAYGAFFLFRNGLHARTGGWLFNEMFQMYYEESDLCHRAWLAGCEVWYVPTHPIFHAHGATAASHLSPCEVKRKIQRNSRISFLTCFGLRGLFTVLLPFEILSMGQSLVRLLKCDASQWRACCFAWREVFCARRDIVRERKIVQSFRRISDKELFKTIMRPIPAGKLMRAIRGMPLC